MAEGGIYDQLGGGFARYAIDAHWLVPHFEKMLYDNAQLLVLASETWQMTREPRRARRARDVAYLERDLRAPEGGFYTAEDADSEGVEGKFYVWTPEEVRAVVSDRAAADAFMRCYDVTDAGNWHDPHGHGPAHASILHVVDRPRGTDEERAIVEAKKALLAARESACAPASTTRCSPATTAWRLPGSPKRAASSATPRSSTARAAPPSSCSAI